MTAGCALAAPSPYGIVAKKETDRVTSRQGLAAGIAASCGVVSKLGAGALAPPASRLFFGDNLDILREKIKDESVDLVYLDPPFNSQARYNVLFQSPVEEAASAQVGAFLDFWSWHTGEAEKAYHQIMTQVGGQIATFISALRSALGESDMMAYLVMMALRLVELKRVLKPDGSIYLHCDPTASHYLKVLLDGIFGPGRFQNEVIWKRTSAHNSANRWGPIHDTILFYSVSDDFTWENQVQPYDQEYIDAFFVHEDEDGSRWARADLTGSGVRYGDSGKPWRGIDVTAKGRHWAVPQHELDRLDREGKIHWPRKSDGMPRLKKYVHELPGMPLQDLILDVKPVHNVGRVRLGYPTQKPIKLLDRIIRASSKRGQVVLDPFCGCGTTVHAAQDAQRQWIGIDVSIHAIHVIEERMRDAFGDLIVPKAEGIPADFESAERLANTNPFQFQWWANYLLGAHRLNEIKKGKDRGIDGESFFPNGPGRAYGRMIISAKAGHTGPAHVRELRGVIDREKAEMGVFVCLNKPTPGMEEEAVTAGFVTLAQGTKRRLQIVSIADWFEGHGPDVPHRDQLPYDAFSARPRRGRARPDPKAPELPLTFLGGMAEGTVERHFNPRLVKVPKRGAA
jgi:site-specific DNA-methyltransferase (adenine-specific)